MERQAAAGEAGLAGAAGEAAGQGDPSTAGGKTHGAGGEAGDVLGGGGLDAGGGVAPVAGGVSSDAGASFAGAAGADRGTEVPPIFDTFGCFAVSGDGWDFLGSGEPASIVATETRCGGGRSISDNVDALAQQVTPTSIDLRRSFVIDDAILASGNVTLSFAADDAATFTLNGQAVAGCIPPDADTAQCSQTCQVASIPAEALRGGGEVNLLEIQLTNLLSVDAGGGNWGWTHVLYSMCITAK
jgi:hypothetical protein